MTLQVTSLAPARGPGRGPLALALLPILLPVAGPVVHKAGRAAPAGRISQPLYLLLLSQTTSWASHPTSPCETHCSTSPRSDFNGHSLYKVKMSCQKILNFCEFMTFFVCSSRGYLMFDLRQRLIVFASRNLIKKATSAHRADQPSASNTSLQAGDSF